MWDLPGPGLEPMSPALASGFLTTAPPGKSCTSYWHKCLIVTLRPCVYNWAHYLFPKMCSSSGDLCLSKRHHHLRIVWASKMNVILDSSSSLNLTPKALSPKYSTYIIFWIHSLLCPFWHHPRHSTIIFCTYYSNSLLTGLSESLLAFSPVPSTVARWIPFKLIFEYTTLLLSFP